MDGPPCEIHRGGLSLHGDSNHPVSVADRVWKAQFLGTGSSADQHHLKVHDRLLPPLAGLGPQLTELRHREIIDIDPDLHTGLIECLLETADSDSFYNRAFVLIEGWTTSWTRLQRTLHFVKDTLDPEDAELLPLTIKEIRDIVDKLSAPETWPCLGGATTSSRGTATIADLEGQCGQIAMLLAQHGVPVPRRSFVLHLFSGRRRRGDVQFYLDALASRTSDCNLHVISIDIVICPIHGDVMKAETCQFWLDAIRRGYVLAMLAGPPCESWSRARGIPLKSSSVLQNMARQRGPRIIRDIHNL